MLSNDFYPFNISEARYSGVYEGNPYILIAGVFNPRKVTDAFGGDIPCADFWCRVEDEGPVLTIELPEDYPEDETKIYAASGPHPVALFEQFESFKQKVDRKHDNQIINTVMKDYPDVTDVAINGDNVSRHMLAAIAATRPQTASGSVHGRVANRMLEERFEGETKPFRNFDEETKQEVREFVEENETEYLKAQYQDYSDLFREVDEE